MHISYSVQPCIIVSSPSLVCLTHVQFYNGVEHMVHPFTLASHDIVITTYNVLRKEVYYATTGE